jgi:hypothetical protein
MTSRGRALLQLTTRVGLASLVATLALLVSAAAALADSASISVTAADGSPDPVAYIARVFTISGTASAGKYLYVKHRPVGGAPCAPSAYSDSGRLTTGFYGSSAADSFAIQRVWTWDAPGNWTFCMWLASSETAITTPIAQTITFRTPGAQVGVSLRPSVPKVGERAQVTIAGATEAPRRIWAKVRPGPGAACAPTYDLDSGQSLIDGWDADGAFDAKRYTTQSSPGQYLICAWLAGSSFDPWPVAGPQALAFNVVTPPPVVSSVATLNCASRSAVARVRASNVKSVCLRYRFSTPPSAGTRLSLSYVTPARRTYKTVTSTWPSKRSQTMTLAALPARAYKHRRGTWRAILRVGARQLKRTTFRVI